MMLLKNSSAGKFDPMVGVMESWRTMFMFDCKFAMISRLACLLGSAREEKMR